MENKKYDHKFIEQEVNKQIKDKNFYEISNNGTDKYFSIILPPPNVTGQLHLGHAWDASLQDAIIRYKHLHGFNTLWISGLDHASIATQSKYEKILAEKKVTRFNLGREKFLEELNVWSQKQASTIRNQWDKFNLALSRKTETFTMDKNVNELVNECFVKLYKDGLLYQDLKLVNWDTQLQTAISDIEIVHKETKSKMYYFKYPIKDSKANLVVATTRPETMFGDVCLVVNPEDKRYKKYIGKFAINPANGKALEIISDSYVDKEFGTGVMKVTPAHDFNDYELAKRHNITEYKNILNANGTLNSNAYDYVHDISYDNLTTLQARKLLVENFERFNDIEKIEEINNNVAYSDRTNTIVEPYLSKQWFISMKPLAEKLIRKQDSKDRVEFIPKRFNDALVKWMENIQDWCISRQLWWGHQLPVWYHNDTKEVYVSTTAPENIEDYTRDSDVLDTWFSSGLWPIVTTLYSAKDKQAKNYFPTSLLVTAYDILFFWVARMMNMTEFMSNQKPFDQCLIHGLIRDKDGKKMSKSLGNGIDPIDVINQYGSDALKLFFTSSATLGEDLRYHEDKVKYYWQVLNKIWNSSNLLKKDALGKIEFNLEHASIFDKWMILSLLKLRLQLFELYDKYEFAIANKLLIDCFWNQYCNQYLEFIKVDLNNDVSRKNALFIFNMFLKLFYPIAPMISDYLYKEINNEFIWNTKYEYLDLNKVKFDKDLIETFVTIGNLIKDHRMKNSLSSKETIELFLVSKNKTIIERLNQLFGKQNIKIVETIENIKDDKLTTLQSNKTIVQLLSSKANDESIKKKIIERLKVVVEEIKRAQSMLANKNFIDKAPKEKLKLEQEKLEKYLKEKEELEDLN